MFDPSKLDLEIDDENKNTSEETNSPEEASNSATAKDNIAEKKEIIIEEKEEIKETPNPEVETIDPLSSIPSPEKTENLVEDILITLPPKEAKNEDKEYGRDNEHSYDKKDILAQVEAEEINKVTEEQKVIFDINITKIEDLLNPLQEKEYDFVTVEPNEDLVKIIYRKDKVIVEEKNIKYPTYSQLLLKIKSAGKLKIEETSKSQEGKTEINLQKKVFQLLIKTAASDFWEKIFLKIVEKKWVTAKKEKKAISFWQIFGFLWAGLISVLVIGGAFLWFVLLNANNVADLTFFQNLWIDVGSIKDFVWNLVNVVFASILFIEVVFLMTFTFKAVLTKKEYKQKKIGRIVLSVFFLILMLISAFLWLTLSKKINTLKWLNYWKIEYFDNSKYLSPLFGESGSIINPKAKLIWPITVRFNIEQFMKKLKEDQWFKPSTIIWEFDWEEIEKPAEEYGFIKEFNEKGLHEIKIKISWTNINDEAEVIEKVIANFDIAHMVNIKENPISNGWSIFDFDASELKNLGKIKWYYLPSLDGKTQSEQNELMNNALSKEVLQSYLFTSKPIFDKESLLAMKIVNSKEEEKSDFDKIFILQKDVAEWATASIEAKQSIINELEYTFTAKDIETMLGNGYVESFKWIIDETEDILTADQSELEKSSKYVHEFKSYGKHDISLYITDSRGNTEKITSTIDIPKRLKLKNNLSFSVNNGTFEEVRYEEKVHEYFIDEIWVPTSLKIDAKKIRSSNLLYRLSQVTWDIDSDGDIDKKWKDTEIELNKEGNHIVTVNYRFEHRRISDDKIDIQEKIYIEWIKKEAQMTFEITKESNYAPVIVGFDASKSQVKNEDIVKFVWDYWDGTPIDQRDAVVPGHKYNKPGEYLVKVTAVTESGKKYSAQKKLILNPKPQTATITTSLKKASTGQWIDFFSTESEWNIVAYYWEFGDGSISTKANPTHYYQKSWEYEVKLRLDFANNNIITDKMKINIIED